MHQLIQFHHTLPFHTQSPFTAGEQSAKEACAMTETLANDWTVKKNETKKDKTVVNSLVNSLYINQMLLNINKYLVKVCCVVLVVLGVWCCHAG